MERIALISDIHGNMPALNSVLHDIRNRQIFRIICLGDLIGKGPEGDQVVDTLRQCCETVLQGNWDESMSKPAKCEVGKWHRERLGQERLAYLGSLPYASEFWLSGRRMRLFHASPFGVHHRIKQFDDLDKRLAMFDNTEHTLSQIPPDVVGYGDLHNAFMQHLGGRLLFNVGSVGNPLDFPLACYTIIEGVYGKEEPDGFNLQIVRVPYDIDEAIKIAEDLKMPNRIPYANELRTAKYRHHS